LVARENAPVGVHAGWTRGTQGSLHNCALIVTDMVLKRMSGTTHWTTEDQA
jgi:hypothetical protein